MKLTVEMLEEWFRRFNDDYFEGQLPMPRLELSRGRTRVGSMSCKRRRRLLRTELYDFCIRVSNYYDCSEREYQNVLLHEMIHYHIAYHRLRDTSAHGRLFRQMMARLNAQGWQITVSARTAGWQPTQQANGNRARLVLALRNARGQCFLSVVNPEYAHLIDYRLRNSPDISWHQWFSSNDDYFRTFPVVRSLRGKRVSAAELDKRMATMTPKKA